MHIAGATPGRFYSDALAALMPNGSTLDHAAFSPYLGPLGNGRAGIQKQQILNGFYGPTDTPTNRFYAPAGTDPSADLVDWRRFSSPPGPFDNPNFFAMVRELTKFHSAYYVNDADAPAPMLMSNGYWDDFVPVDEAVSYYNKIRTDHPRTPVALSFGDVGHARSADRDQDAETVLDDAWLDYYVKGVGARPQADPHEILAFACRLVIGVFTKIPHGGRGFRHQ